MPKMKFHTATVIETFERFLNSRKASGVVDKTIQTYRYHFAALSKYLKSLSVNRTCADCAVRFFVRWRQNFAGRLTPVKKFGRYMTENMQARWVRTICG